MTEANFDRIAEEYDESLPPHVVEHYLDKRVAYVRRHLPGRAGGSTSAAGPACSPSASPARGYAMSGLDPSEGMLDGAGAASSRRCAAVRGSGTELPFEDSSFDLVLTVAALHHIADPEAIRATLAEMVRVLRPSGRIVVWDHNPRNPYWKRLMARVPQDDGSERLIPEDEVARRAARRRAPSPALRPARPRARLRPAAAARARRRGRATGWSARPGCAAALRPQRRAGDEALIYPSAP